MVSVPPPLTEPKIIMVFVTLPNVRYRETFLDGLVEYQSEGRHLDMDLRLLRRDFAGFVRGVNARADASRVPRGWVPSTELWLIDDDLYIGTSHIRHELNPHLRRYGGHIGYEIRPSRRRQGYGKAILRLTLAWAGKLGLERALVTCDTNNVGSRKIIEANGGVFEGDGPVTIGTGVILERRYWIEIPPPAGDETA